MRSISHPDAVVQTHYNIDALGAIIFVECMARRPIELLRTDGTCLLALLELEVIIRVWDSMKS